MTPSKKNLEKFNTLQHVRLWEQQKALFENVYLKNLVLNVFVMEGGIANELSFIKY